MEAKTPSPRLPPDPTDLEYVQARISSVVHTRFVIPYHALIYRLCEVGPVRFDPRSLHNAVRTVAAHHHTLREVHPGLFASPLVSGTPLGWATRKAIATLRAINDPPRLPVLAALTEALFDETGAVRGAAHDSPSPPLPPPTHIAANIEVTRPSVMHHVTSHSSAPIIIWVTHELPWIYPDDPRLWTLLRRADDADAHAILIARKVAPATFALAKALGFHALQYYGTFVPLLTADLASAAHTIGWLPLFDVNSMRRHAVLGHLRAIATRLNQGNPSAPARLMARQAIRRALDTGLDRHIDVSTTTITVLSDWTTESGIQLPPAWYDNITRWAAADRRVRPEPDPLRGHQGR